MRYIALVALALTLAAGCGSAATSTSYADQPVCRWPARTRQGRHLFATWCRARSLALFAVRRADIECFARELEALGRARATVTRRVCTIAAFYKYAVEEDLLEHSTAAHVRRPRVDYESHAVALDRNGRHHTVAALAADGYQVLTF